jgi:Zn-dependent alcohol dehydrogenase
MSSRDTSVKAAVCHEHGQPLVIEDVLLASPGHGEIEVAVGACAICHSDISYLEGAWGGSLPAVYGHEAAGVVTEIGPGVGRVEPGRRVVVTLVRSCGGCFFCVRGEPALCESTFPLDKTGPLRSREGEPIVQGLRTGAFAERVVVHESQVVAVPEELPLDCASLLACGVLTGFGAVVNTAHVHAGESVVVMGTGGVGLNSVQAAALSGAEPIVAVDLDDAKLQAARTFGATHTVNPAREDARDAVLGLTCERGADHVLVTAGAAGAIESGLRLVRRGGTLVVVGMPASGVTAVFDPTDLAHDGRRILGSKMGSARPARDVPKLVELYGSGRLKLAELISGRYRLEEINEAVASSIGGVALRNVVVFDLAR